MKVGILLVQYPRSFHPPALLYCLLVLQSHNHPVPHLCMFVIRSQFVAGALIFVGFFIIAVVVKPWYIGGSCKSCRLIHLPYSDNLDNRFAH
jgi:hypothetical protein